MNYHFKETQNLTDYKCINVQHVHKTQLLNYRSYTNYKAIIANLIWHSCIDPETT